MTTAKITRVDSMEYPRYADPSRSPPGENEEVRVLAISGSLRAISSHAALLKAAAIVAPAGVQIEIYERLGDLPPFNPDWDGDGVFEAVDDFRRRLKSADGVIFSSPEYAHGAPGVLKNSLDWLVGSGELVDKPVALFNASPRGTYAQASLTETLTVMSARLIPEAAWTLQHLGKPLATEQIVADPEMSVAIHTALENLARAIAHAATI
jgi:NAD(P)H-dependent FMN reductase